MSYLRWGPSEKWEVARLLEAKGWTRDDFCRRRGFPQLRKRQLVVSFSEERTALMQLITREGDTSRHVESVRWIDSIAGRGWRERLVERIEETFRERYGAES